MNPSTDLFNDGSLAPQWTVENPDPAGTVVEEGRSGSRALKVVFGAGATWYVTGYGVRTSLVGDFDVLAVLQGYPTIVDGFPYFGVSTQDFAQYTVCRFYTQGGGAFVVVSNGSSGGSSNGEWNRVPSSGAGPQIHRQFARLSRYGSTLRAYQWYRGEWLEVAVPAAWSAGAADLYLRLGGLDVNVPHAGYFCRGVIALPLDQSGVLAAPAAPNGGYAASSPSADGGNLGVAVGWAAPPANLLRTWEVQCASDAGFTGLLDWKQIDGLMDGDAPTHRLGGLASGTTVYARARFVDELGQAGAWSLTVSATAEGPSPVIVRTSASPGSPQTSETYGYLVDEALQDHCLADAGLRRLVGDRIYPEFAPASAVAPYVLRTRISSAPHDHLAGEAAIGSPTYQFTVVARSNRERNAVAEVLRASLSRYSGPMGTEDVEISSPEEADDLESAADGSERRLFVRRLDFEVWHSREPVR